MRATGLAVSTGNLRASCRDGVRFQSTRAAERWRDLRTRELAGEIRALKARPRFHLKAWSPSGAVESGRYTADFAYIEDGRRVVEDIRRPARSRHEARDLARWILQANYPDIRFREV